MSTTLDIFISSKMVELKPERDALYALLPTLDYGDIKLRAWVFEEDAPAAEQSIRQIYLKALQNSALYIGLFWNQYGEWTIDEFDRAGEWGIERHIYVKDVDADQRVPELTNFLNKNGDVQHGLTAKWFKTTDELLAAVKQTLDEWVKIYRSGPKGDATGYLYKTAPEIVERADKLIGRDDLITKVEKLLHANGKVLLQGFSGTGKTALAAEIAAQHAPVLWVRAGRHDSAALFEALARPFDVQMEMAKQSEDGKIRLLRSLLISQGIKLLVVDDVWNGQALQAVIKAVPPTIPLFVTSRRRYGVDEIIKIDDLVPEKAVELLSFHARKDHTQDSSAFDLCKFLGHLAFAVRIAGITLKMRTWKPDELQQRINNPAELALPLDLHEPGRENVAKLIQVSLDAVDDETKTVFLVCGAFFDTTFTMELLWRYFAGEPEVSDEMLAQIRTANPQLPDDMPADELRPLIQNTIMAQQDTRSLNDILTRLADSGLIDYIPETDDRIPHYRLHDLAYSYAAAQNDADRRSRALDACLLYMRRYTEPSPQTFRNMRPVLDNLLGASAWAFAAGRYAESEDFAWKLYIEGSNILDYDCFYITALALLKRSVKAAQQRGDKSQEGKHHNHLGTAYHKLGNYNLAIEQYEDALEISRSLGDQRAEGNALGNLGIAYDGLGDYPRAIKQFEATLAIARTIGNPHAEGNALGNLGNAYLNLKDYTRAIEHHQAALAIRRAIGERQAESNHISKMEKAYDTRRNYPRALDFFSQSRAIFAALGLQHLVEQTDRNITISRARMEKQPPPNAPE